MYLHARHQHMKDIPIYKSQHFLLIRKVILTSPRSVYLFKLLTWFVVEAPSNSEIRASTNPVLKLVVLFLNLVLRDVPSFS